MVRVSGHEGSSPTVPVPLSFAQQRMWFLDQLIPVSGVYNVPALYEVHGPLDIPLLGRCLSALMQRHQPLRTAVRSIGGEPHQVIMPPGALPVPLACHDLRDWGEQQRRLRIQELAAASAATRLRLDRPPLWRAEVVTDEDRHHLLMLAFHHLVVDGSSLVILMNELVRLYAAGPRDPSPLPPLPVNFADFAVAQREEMSGEDAAALRAYWREQLRGAPQLLELPGDRPRPAEPSYRGGAVEFALPAALRQGLRELATRLRTTPFVLLLAAFASLLHRHTGRTDLLLGTPVSGRTRPEWEPLVGCLLNTVVIRTDLAGEPRFADLVQRAKATVLSALDHQAFPFELLLTELAPERAITHHPLFQVLVALTHLDTSWETPDLTIRELPPAWNGTSKLDLAITWYQTPTELSGALQYAADLFDRGTAERIVGHLLALIRSVLADPTELVSRQELLVGAERTQILATSRGPHRLPQPASDRAVHLLVIDQARQRPGALALADDRRRLTYRMLIDQATGLADRLRRLGAGPDTLVATCLPRGIDLVLAELGIMIVGAAFLPIDPASPARRRSRILDEARPCAVVTSSAYRDQLAGTPAPLLSLDTLAGNDPPAPPAPPAPTDPDHLAYVIYTSGSTGTPKGVMISHRSLANLVAWYRDAVQLTPGDRCTAMMQPAFDASVLEIWPALTAGTSVHFVPERAIGSPTEIRDWLLAMRATVSIMIAALGEAVMKLRWPVGAPLRLLVVGGERLHHGPDPALPFQVWNQYGPTEGTVVASAGLVGLDGRPPSIGRPLPGIETYVLNGRMQPAPVGVPGELYLGGTGLGRGYLARPDLTADRFVPHPWRAGQRLYRTGDLVRWRGDELDFLGRIDHQIKLRGFRIEPAETEAALISHPAVAEAVVSVIGGRLVAHVAVTRKIDASELRGHLAEQLPSYLIPVDYAILAELPRTANGKLDPTALPPPVPATDAAFQPPRTDLERGIARIWLEVLGVTRVGVHDGFFALGGNSLALAQVHARLAEVTPAELPLVALYEHQTIAALSRHLCQDRVSVAADPAGAAPSAGARAAGQERLARLRQLRQPSLDRRNR